jgi:hypothetical protein
MNEEKQYNIQGGKCRHHAPKNSEKCWKGAEVLKKCWGAHRFGK